MSFLENPLEREVGAEVMDGGQPSYGISKSELQGLVLELSPQEDVGELTVFGLLSLYRKLRFTDGNVSGLIQRELPVFHMCANLKDSSYSKHSSWFSDNVFIEQIEEGDRAFCYVQYDGRVVLLKRFKKVGLQLAWEEESFWLPVGGEMRLVLDVIYDAERGVVTILDVVGTQDNPAAFVGMSYTERQALLEGVDFPTEWLRYFKPSVKITADVWDKDVVESWRNSGVQGFILKHKDGKYRLDNRRGGYRSVDSWLRSKFSKEGQPVVKEGYERAFIRGMLKDGYGRVIGVELAVVDGASWRTIGAALNISKKLCLLWEKDKKAFERDYLKAVVKVSKDSSGAYVIDSLAGNKDILETGIKGGG